MAETIKPKTKEFKPSAKKSLGAIAVETENKSTRHLVLKQEAYAGLSHADILTKIINKVDALGLREEGTKLVFSGFRGRQVYNNQSFGNRWYTWGVGEDEATKNVHALTVHEPNPVAYAFTADEIMPAVGVFNGDKLRPIPSDPAMDARYTLETHGGVADPDQFGVAEGSLDDAALAVIYFAPHKRS